MEIRMIAADLDRTLLRTDKSISGYTASVLRACRGRGIRLVYATGRPLRAVRDYCEQVPCDALICHNGAVIEYEGRRVHFGIPQTVRNDILRMLLREYPDPSVSLEADDRHWSNFDCSAVWPGIEYIPTDFSDPRLLPDLPADKILLCLNTREQLDALNARLPAGCYAELAEDAVAMIMSRSAAKWNAVRRLCAVWGMSTESTAAFGDDWNDCEMLASCGVGIAVANAIPEARAAADRVCASNDEDGPAHWIEENILYNGGSYES